jgi:hypothetical protein
MDNMEENSKKKIWKIWKKILIRYKYIEERQVE